MSTQPVTSLEDEVQSFWCADDSDRRYYAHYREELTPQAWNAWGDTVMEKIRSFVELKPEMRVLDYGCGGGAVTVRLLQAGAFVHAVDICREALDETMSIAREMGLQNRLLISGVYADEPNPYYLDFYDRYDLIICTAVFQHFSSKEYASKVLEFFGRIASKKTKAVIQIRNDDGNPQFAQKTGDYKSQAITYTSHSCTDFIGRATDAGWTVYRIEHGAYNYAWYYMR